MAAEEVANAIDGASLDGSVLETDRYG